MKKMLLFAGLLMLSALLCAEIGYWPRLSLIEMGLDTTTPECDDARAGLAACELLYPYGEAVTLCYYSGEYTSDYSDDMMDLLGITTLPTAVFDRDEATQGGGEVVAGGYIYSKRIKLHYYDASPVQEAITSFSTATGEWVATFTMLDPDLLLINTSVQVFLIEDDVADGITHVLRDMQTTTFTIGGQGSTETLSGTFTLDSAWNADNLHVVAVLLDENDAYVQAASSYPAEDIGLQPAVPYDTDVVGPSWADNGNYNYNGEFFGLVNYGETADFLADLIGENVPDGMSLMYCYEDSQGNAGCFNPSGGPFEFSLPAGDWITFHLLIPTVTQACSLNYQFTFSSASRPVPLLVPFTFRTADYNDVNDDTTPAVRAQLQQNSPNPFNPSTRISFSMAVAGAAKLDVYNVRGEHICSLVDETLAAGNHDVTWSGRDDAGRAVSSGVYLYRLSTASGAETRRMVLLK